MKVIFYTSVFYLDTALNFIKYISKKVDLFVFIELPSFVKNNILELNINNLKSGIYPAEDYINDKIKNIFKEYWIDTKSFDIVFHKNKKTIHYQTYLTTRKVVNEINNIKPDILHIDDISLRLAIGMIGINKIPIIMNVHDPFPHTGEHNWRKDTARILAFRKTKKFLLFNKSQIDDFSKKYKISKDKIKFVHLGIPEYYENICADNENEHENIILFFGRFSKYKGIEILIGAFKILSEELNDITLILAGRNATGYSLPELPKLKNNCRIEVINRYISNDELCSLFKKSAFVVCPYTDATQSGVILTAYSFNKPVIATNVGGLTEYVKDQKTGIVIEPKNHVMLYESIKRLIIDKKLRNYLKDNIRLLKREELSWENFADNILNLYKN